jgi:hypothetical protein
MGSHAAIGMAATKVIRTMDGSSWRWILQGTLFALQAGFDLKRDGDLAGCGVMTFFIAIKIAGLPHHWARHKPIGETTAQMRGSREAAACSRSVGLGKGGFGRRDVSTVAINHEHPFKAMAR